MTKVLIIEDETPAANRIEKMLLETNPSLKILAKLQSIQSAVAWFKSNPQPDLIILDIQLADGTSFEIFNQVKVESFVIFTTAYDEYAIRAFELNSIDYLLKPVEKEKLYASLEKFQYLQRKQNVTNVDALLEIIKGQKKEYKKHFLVNINQKIKSININDIAYFYSSDGSTYFKNINSVNYPLDYSLDQLESMLDPEMFFRLNRKYLASRDSLDKIYILSRSRIRTDLKPVAEEPVFVSNARAHEFRLWLDT